MASTAELVPLLGISVIYERVSCANGRVHPIAQTAIFLIFNFHGCQAQLWLEIHVSRMGRVA